ncbi:MAG: serine hydrolase, partial [Hyphomonadaceae bacterium]|nr:serine hydrolase [Hyphomonadaceae bacterium]
MRSLTRRTTLSALAAAPVALPAFGLGACSSGPETSVPAAAQPTSANPPDVAEAVAPLAQAFMARTLAPGLAIGLAGPAGRRLYLYGARDPAAGMPVEENTLFELGSISKTYTVALAAIAVQDGAMRWDDAPGRHVPEVRGAGTDRLTALHLATHCTGGMPPQFPDEITDWPSTAAW